VVWMQLAQARDQWKAVVNTVMNLSVASFAEYMMYSASYKCLGLNFFLRIYLVYFLCKSRDSSVGIALGYGLDDRGSRVRFPAGTGNFSLHDRVHNGSEAHPASYPMGTRVSFPGGKTAGA
jgi:hypothetical protein